MCALRMYLVSWTTYYFCFCILTTGHLEKLWAYLNIQQLMDQYELNKNENSTEKAKALELALEVIIYKAILLTRYIGIVLIII